MYGLYGKYSQKVLSKWKPFEKKNWKYYPCPGCILHSSIVGRRRGDVLFRNYVERPQTSHHLYWRTHPVEYKTLIDRCM